MLMPFLGFDKYKSGFANELVEEVGLETIQKEADFISFHIPLSAENVSYTHVTFPTIYAM